MEKKTPLVAICGNTKCKHEWTIAYIPMAVEDLCAVIGTAPRCPMCACLEVYVKCTL